MYQATEPATRRRECSTWRSARCPRSACTSVSTRRCSRARGTASNRRTRWWPRTASRCTPSTTSCRSRSRTGRASSRARRSPITHLAWIDSCYFRDLPLPVLPARRPERTPPLPPPAVADAHQASTAASAKFDGHIQSPMYRFELVPPAQLDPSRVAFTEISNTSLDTVCTMSQ